jgi:hypothetical protein
VRRSDATEEAMDIVDVGVLGDRDRDRGDDENWWRPMSLGERLSGDALPVALAVVVEEVAVVLPVVVAVASSRRTLAVRRA